MAGVNTAAGKEWTLTTLNGKKIDVAKPPTMMFAQGKLAIFGGINRLTGSYALVERRRYHGRTGQHKDGRPAELMKLEREFARSLRLVDGFHVHGNELELLSKGAVVATLRSEK